MSNTNNVNESMIETLKRRNIDYSIIIEPQLDSNGNPVRDEKGNIVNTTKIVINKVPQLEQEITQVFSRSTPCWFPECEDIRRRYFLDVDRAVAAGGCTDCQKGAIIRTYEAEVRAAINKLHEKDETTNNPGTTEISGADGASPERTGRCKEMLRRASSLVKKVFRLGKRDGGEGTEKE